MTRIPRYIFILLILLLPLSATNMKTTHIHVIALEHKKELWPVKFKLDELGHPSYIGYKEQKYHVYAGPFKTRSHAEKALQTIKRNISRNAFIVGVAPAAEPMADKAAKSPIETEMAASSDKPVFTHLFEEGKLFLGLSTGYSSVDMIQRQQGAIVLLDTDTGDSGVTYGIEAGYSVNDTLFVTLNYHRTYLRNVNLDDFYATFNYALTPALPLSPYVGAMAGCSLLTWEKEISGVSDNPNRTGTSLLFGLQAGVEYDLRDDLSLYAAGRYWVMDHTTKVNVLTETIELKHVSQLNGLLGIKYRF